MRIVSPSLKQHRYRGRGSLFILVPTRRALRLAGVMVVLRGDGCCVLDCLHTVCAASASFSCVQGGSAEKETLSGDEIVKKYLQNLRFSRNLCKEGLCAAVEKGAGQRALASRGRRGRRVFLTTVRWQFYLPLLSLCWPTTAALLQDSTKHLSRTKYLRSRDCLARTP